MVGAVAVGGRVDLRKEMRFTSQSIPAVVSRTPKAPGLRRSHHARPMPATRRPGCFASRSASCLRAAHCPPFVTMKAQKISQADMKAPLKRRRDIDHADLPKGVSTLRSGSAAATSICSASACSGRREMSDDSGATALGEVIVLMRADQESRSPST